MRIRAMLLPATILLLFGMSPLPQGQSELAQFQSLPAESQNAVLAAIETRLRASDDPALRRIQDLAATATDLGALVPVGHYLPAEFAPVAPARTVFAVGSTRQVALRQQFPVPPFLRELHPRVCYDWAAGKPGLGPVPSASQRFSSLLAGLPPGSDAAVAMLLQQFDADFEQRCAGAWLEHTYADRDGRVFAGITLYDAWYSGKTVEVPDVDAIAFARLVLRTDSFVSPIPEGRRRERLYQQIHDAFGRFREYRTLREAAAAAFVSAEPDLDPIYRELVGRMHFLWARLGFDPARVSQKLNGGDRSELLTMLDDALRGNADAAQLRSEARAALATMAVTVRNTALDELQKAKAKPK